MHSLYKIPLFFAKLLYPCKIYGKENIPKGSAVLVCNHFHAVDCVYVAMAYNSDISFLAKKELFKKKGVSKLLKSLGGIPIDRDNPDMKTMLSLMKILKEGHKLTVFPEGTRNKTGTTELQPIKGGAVLFAVKTKTPVVPVMILKKAKLFVRNKMIIGKPFTLDDFYDKKLSNSEIDDLAEIVSKKMKEEYESLLSKVKRKKWLY